jgi:ATP-dependent exoDNAse (exonuclease V) beta subunit
MNKTSLSTNWRSSKNVIKFNNSIFGYLKEEFGNFLEQFIHADNSPEYKKRIEEMYSGSLQEFPDTSSDGGWVKISFIGESEFETESLKQMVDDIKTIQDQGIQANEIAILIRRKKDGIPILKALFEEMENPDNKRYNFSVLSGESLFLDASEAVRLVIGILTVLTNPDDIIAKAAVWGLSGFEITPSFEEDFNTNLYPKLQRISKKALLM